MNEFTRILQAETKTIKAVIVKDLSGSRGFTIEEYTEGHSSEGHPGAQGKDFDPVASQDHRNTATTTLVLAFSDGRSVR